MSPVDAAELVLGKVGPGLTMYSGTYQVYTNVFPEYRYHFLTHSKPATHLAAMTHLTSSDLKSGMPSVLVEILSHISKNIRPD